MKLRPILFSLLMPLPALAPLMTAFHPVAAGAQTPPGPEGSAAAREVRAGVITLTREQVPISVTLSGQAAAQDAAAIRPLVSGIVTEVLYDPGHPVKKDDPLFRIDSRSYEADLAAAKATLTSAEAAIAPAEAAVSRSERLLGTGSTQETLDSLRMTLAQAQAAVASAQAAVDIAQLNLSRTTVTSPIDGFAELPEVSVGDLLTANQSDALTTVTRLDPIYVDLSEASARMLMMRARFDRGEAKPGDRLDVELTLENGQAFQGKGTLMAVSRTVSTSTGTVLIRVRFDNPQRLIMPGMFVSAKVTLGTAEAVLVPQLAATPNADGTVSVWVLDDQDTARELRLTAEGSTGSAWVVPNGIEAGARLMVDNIDNMIAGTKITPVAVVIGSDGVISDSTAATGADSAADASKPAAGN